MAVDGFSNEWEAIYEASQHDSIWPWSDLVSLVMRHAHPRDGFTRILEIGCGAGANIPLFLSLKADYWAVEGSESVVARLQRRYPALAHSISAGDFTLALPGEGPFDAIVDRSSLTHNSTDAIRRGLGLIFDRLRPGGRYIGIDWFSSAHEASQSGTRVDDHTRRDLPIRQFAGVGAVHFSDEAHLRSLIEEAGFRIELLEHKQRDAVLPEPQRTANWHVMAVRPE